MPGRTISNRFYYVYVLKSVKDKQNYIGYTTNLIRRMREHNEGKSFATAPRRPFLLIYYEACRSYVDAQRREKYLKHSEGRRFLAKRLSHYNDQHYSKLY